MARFEAVLFDFDGVIVDSTPVHLAGWAEAYWEFFRMKVEPEILESLVGQSTAAIGTLLSHRIGRPEMKGELVRRKARYVLDHLPDIPMIAGAKDFMEKLRAKKIRYGIASNAPRGFIESALNKHGLWTDFFLGLEDYKFPKPDPEPYLIGAQRLGWTKSDRSSIAVFEDSAHGIHAAVGAGMTAIGVCSQHPPVYLEDAGAKACIQDFRDHAFLDENFF
ncbi:MAG: HAD family phosphatase [Bdellovibrionota bacterium]